MRKLQVFFAAALIFFLTGCAARGYHTPKTSEPYRGRTGPIESEGNFVWPARGQVVLPYGAREGGVSNKGIVVKLSDQAPVMAAQSGKVVFLDSKLPGYGRTIILEHSAGFSTVYARNAQTLVQIGQWVRQGEVIARAGSEGKGGVPQLYFEIRRNSRAEDPSTYLPDKIF